ncbi:2,4-dichlorophenol 6-monooxygenase, partial [Streptomyces sp. NPDC127092]
LDLTGHGRLSLLVGEGGQPWRDAADKLASELGIDLSVASVGVGCEYNDVLREWTAVREIGDAGALLVRPDHHIAWRAADLPEIPLEALRTALSSVLH